MEERSRAGCVFEELGGIAQVGPQPKENGIMISTWVLHTNGMITRAFHVIQCRTGLVEQESYTRY